MSRIALILSFAALTLVCGIADAQTDEATVSFQDSYTRDDSSPSHDSLGATEPGDGMTVLDYRELDAAGGFPTIENVGRLEGRALLVFGSGTNPAFVELTGVSRNLDFEVGAELLATDVDAYDAANCLTLVLRNTGVAADGTIYTPGAVLVSLEVQGYYEVLGVAPDVNSIIPLAQGHLDAETLRALDVDGDGRLEEGEPFALQITVEDDWLDLRVGGELLVEGMDLSGLPQPPDAGDRLLIGRNRRVADGVPVQVRFDDLRTLVDAVDADGDGFPEGEDCDDADPDTYPGADELCDGLDNDCDGTTPADESDDDGDGVAPCEGDCDDADPSVNPDGVDLPGNAVDENCDGAAACDSSAAWRNHGQFVKCVVREARKLHRQGHIGREERKTLVRDAARSDVGRKGNGTGGSSEGRGRRRGGGRR